MYKYIDDYETLSVKRTGTDNPIGTGTLSLHFVRSGTYGAKIQHLSTDGLTVPVTDRVISTGSALRTVFCNHLCIYVQNAAFIHNAFFYGIISMHSRSSGTYTFPV